LRYAAKENRCEGPIQAETVHLRIGNFDAHFIKAPYIGRTDRIQMAKEAKNFGYPASEPKCNEYSKINPLA